MPKGTTSKETVETRSYDKNFFMVKFAEFLGSPTYLSPRSFSRNWRELDNCLLKTLTEFNENPTKGLIANTRSQTDKRTDGRAWPPHKASFLYFIEKPKHIQATTTKNYFRIFSPFFLSNHLTTETGVF